MKKLLKGLAIALLVVVLLVILAYVASLFAVLALGKTKIDGEPKIIIIFGCDHDGYQLSGLLKGRADAAIEYYGDHSDAVIIASGGMTKGQTISEAECLSNYLVQNGVDEEHIILEDRATTTVENVKFSLQLIRDEGLDATGGVLLVSNEFHIARVRALWQRAAKDVPCYTLAAASSPASDKAKMYLREPFVLIWDFLFSLTK